MSAGRWHEETAGRLSRSETSHVVGCLGVFFFWLSLVGPKLKVGAKIKKDISY
jgi:hypothetical protein